MYKFDMEAPIVVESEEVLIAELEEIVHKIRCGQYRDFIPGECQCMEWTVDPEYDPDDDYGDV